MISGNGDDGVYVENDSVVTITGSVISGNSYDGVDARSDSAVTITGSTISGNSYEGVHAWSHSVVTITGSTISGNSDDGVNASLRSGVTIESSTISGNGDDGVDAWNDSAVTIGNSTISGNTVHGVRAWNDSAVTLTNTTISGSGNGLATLNEATITLKNVIIADSGTQNCGAGSTVVDGLGNWVEDGTCGITAAGDPALGPLQMNGGKTATHSITWSGTAYDSGVGSTCQSVGSVDQRGESRSASCSPGAFEPQIPYECEAIVVNTVPVAGVDALCPQVIVTQSFDADESGTLTAGDTLVGGWNMSLSCGGGAWVRSGDTGTGGPGLISLAAKPNSSCTLTKENKGLEKELGYSIDGAALLMGTGADLSIGTTNRTVAFLHSAVEVSPAWPTPPSGDPPPTEPAVTATTAPADTPTVPAATPTEAPATATPTDPATEPTVAGGEEPTPIAPSTGGGPGGGLGGASPMTLVLAAFVLFLASGGVAVFGARRR